MLLRRILGFSQGKLAGESKTSHSTVNLLESGFADPRLSTIIQVAQALSVMPGFLLGGGASELPSLTPGPTAAAQLRELYQRDTEDLVSPGRCPLCSFQPAPGHVHVIGECTRVLHESGRPTAHLAAMFGIKPRAIEAILDAEYGVKR